MSSKYDISVGELLESFDTIGDWTITGGTGEIDSTISKEGAGSLKLTSPVGGLVTATKTVDWDLSRGGRIYLWVYVADRDKTYNVPIALSNDSSFTNYFTMNLQFHGGWNKVLLSRTNTFTSIGSPTWASNIVRIRVRTTGEADVQSIVYFDSMYYKYDTRPKVIVSFDDNWASVYSYGFDYMRTLGIKGCLYTVSSYIDQGGRMTLAQMREALGYGWDILNHTKTHPDLTTLTEAQIITELADCRDWIISNGLSRNNGELHVAYRGGYYNALVLQIMESLGMITGRTTINRTQANEIDSKYELTRQSHDYTIVQAIYRGWIDRAIAEGGCVQINYHNIVADGTGAASTEVEISQFKDMMNYIASKSAVIDCVTFTEWYRGITNSRKLV